VRFAAAGLAAAVFVAACGCATAGSAQVQTDLEAIQNQLWKIQKDNATMLAQIDALRAAPVAGTGLPALAEMRVRLEAVEGELRAFVRGDESDGRLSA
jgi:cob(I)alamin adenosyltransferase